MTAHAPDDDATRDLIGAWALDAVDDDERAAVEELLARDPQAAREARSLRETAGVLAAAAARPVPPEVRAATLAAVARTPQVPTVPAGTVGVTDLAAARARRRPRTRWVAVAAAAAAVVLAVPVTVAVQQAQRAAVVEARLSTIERLLQAPDARLVAGDVAGGGSVVAVVTGDEALVSASDVADPGDDSVYQLWVLRDGAPRSAGLASVTAGGFELLTSEYRDGDALAVTVEPAGGSPAPTTDPVVVLQPA